LLIQAKLCYTIPMTSKHILTAALALLASFAAAGTAYAYISPEDVLLNKSTYLPPNSRGAPDRLAAQQDAVATKQQREFNILVESQHPTAQSSSSAVSSAADTTDPTKALSADDQELLRTARILQRVQKNQIILQYGGRTLDGSDYHGGAPLAPSGAGGVLSAIVMIGAVGWTIVRAKMLKKGTRLEI